MAVAVTQSSSSPDQFSSLRAQDFNRLDELGQVYLDYTGAALYPSSLLDQHALQLKNELLGNPHSINPSSLTATRIMVDAKESVLRFFSAPPDRYDVVFTANATAAIKLVAESFPFGIGSKLLLAADNHNSVNGIREYAAKQQSDIRYLAIEKGLGFSTKNIEEEFALACSSPSLFAYPAQSNFSGVQHSLNLISHAQAAGYRVLLDAAAYVPSNSLNLNQVQPDFVCISFYKMFGYPTGIGALIVRKDALAELERPWFSGGTVEFASTNNQHRLYTGSLGFTDGTSNFTSMSAVINGLSYLTALGMDNINNHCKKFGKTLSEAMQSLQHTNGQALVKFYGDKQQQYGSTRAFNLIDKAGQIIPYELVEAKANKVGISIRGGCFCNPGCAETALDFPMDKLNICLNALQSGEFSYGRLADCLERNNVGALRISWGIANTDKDIDRFIKFLLEFIDA